MGNRADRTGSAGAALVVVLASCVAGPPAVPPPPPAIEYVGVPQAIGIGPEAVTYRLADGDTLQVDVSEYRVLSPAGWSGELVVLGSDTDGRFVASFMRQAGLPDHCYVENETGIDRGGHIEIRGILWPKAAGFTPADAVSPGAPYPNGTRFCFTEQGEIGSTVAR